MPEAKAADTASLHGTIGNSMGIDMSGAYVSIYLHSSSFIYPTTLDQAAGTYSFDGISPGSYQASFQINGIEYRKDLNIAPGDNVFDYTFAGSTSPGNGTVSGKMYQPDGIPTAGNQITLQSADSMFLINNDYWYNSSTGNDGNFIFYNVPPGNYVIEGYMNSPSGGADSNITVLADGTIVRNLYLSAYDSAKQISGMLTDSTGNDVSANVYLYNDSTNELLNQSAGNSYNFYNLNSGNYLIKAVTPDGEYSTAQQVTLTDASQSIDLQLTNAAPSLTWNVTGSYIVGSQLSVVQTDYSDAEEDPEGTPLYQWLSRDHGTNDFYAISGATGSSYTIRPEDAGKDITVFVTPVAARGTLQGETTASMEYQVQDISGFGSALPTSAPVQAEPFSLALSGVTDFNGGIVDGTFEVKATSGGTVIADGQVAFAAGSGTLTGVTLDAADDQTLYVQVIGAMTPQLVTVTLLPNQAPTISVSLSGQGAVGSTITANVYDYSDAEGDPQDSSEYQWETSSSADGTFTPIAGATDDHYTAQLIDFGTYIAVAATPKALNGTKSGAAVLSAPIYIAPGPVSFQMEPSLPVHAVDANQPKSYPAWIEAVNAGVPTEQVVGTGYTVTTDAKGALLFSTLPAIDAQGNLTFEAHSDVEGDAAVTVSMKVSLLDGTVSESEGQSFDIHVDTMHVAISGVEDGQSYNTTVTPAALQAGDYSVTLTRYWSNGDGVTSQVVDDYTLGTPISDEGQYVLDVQDNGSWDFDSYSFTVDKTAPIISFFINGEQLAWTSSRSVVLYANPTNELSDQSLKIMVSDNGADWSSPQDWSEEGTSWQLPEGDGEKTVYVKMIDRAGNVSEPTAASIYLSTAGVPLGVAAYPEEGMIHYANGVILDVTNVGKSGEAGTITADPYQGDWTGAGLQAVGPVLSLSGSGYSISSDTPASIEFPMPEGVNESQVSIYALTTNGNWQPLSTTKASGYATAAAAAFTTYGLFVSNPVPAAPNADLLHLSLSVGNLSPAFVSSQTEYTVYVDDQTSSETVTAGASQSGSTLVINGLSAPDMAPQTIQLNWGTTSVPIIVTASDGMTTKAYKVKFVRGALKSLSTSPVAIPYTPGMTQYSVTVGQSVYSISISVAAQDPGAQISINNTLSGSNGGTVTQSVYLNDTTTTVPVRIVSPNNYSATYTIVVYKSGITAMSFHNISTVTGTIYGPVVWTTNQSTVGDFIQVYFMDNNDGIIGQPVMTISDPSAGSAVVPATAIPDGAAKIGLELFSADRLLLGKQSALIGHNGVINAQDVLSSIKGHSGSWTQDQVKQLLQQITSLFVK